MDGHGITAYGDESVRLAADPPVYLLGATILGDSTDIGPLAALKPRGARKLHWREMTDRLRAASVEALAKLDQMSVVVVGTPLDVRKQERARRKCLETLLPYLEGLGVGRLVLEGRFAKADLLDIEIVDALRAGSAIASIQLEHLTAQSDRRLWVPDQILGAVGDEMCRLAPLDVWGESWRVLSENVVRLETSPR